MLIKAVVTTVKILKHIEKNCEKEILSVSCVDKSCCDDCAKTAIHKELLSVRCVDKSCCDDIEDTKIQI